MQTKDTNIVMTS